MENTTRSIDIKDLWQHLEDGILVDVRTPAEYEQGHIPQALNLPLFTNEERAVVGTIYKRQGPEKALESGLEFVGPKMAGFIGQVRKMTHGKKIVIHCWRGGKRSQSMAWLLGMAGFDVSTITGGYKQYRNFLLRNFENQAMKMVVLGGRTGCGKTEILHALAQMGEQVIDLEGLAHHKGSAFGALGELPQPTVEQFENRLFEQFRNLDPNRRVWIENESRRIGKIYLPDGIWQQMKTAPLINIDLPFNSRVDFLAELYGQYSKQEIWHAFEGIQKKLGGLNMKLAEEALNQDDFKTAATIALHYYDKSYQYLLDQNEPGRVHMVTLDDHDEQKSAKILIEYCSINSL